jgi:hypothetical protein
LDRAFIRLYNFDFPGTYKILDESTRGDPAHPLNYSIRAAAYLFSELDRLKILEIDFFMDDDKVVARKRLKPDPAVREAFFKVIEEARRRATPGWLRGRTIARPCSRCACPRAWSPTTPRSSGGAASAPFLCPGRPSITRAGCWR